MSLDKIDLNIIKVLQQDGRITNQKLADQVALSPSACLERTKKLEKNGYIRGYQTDIAIEKIAPYSAVLVEITLKNHRAEDFQRFEKSIADIPEIVECHAVGGGIDYVAKFIAQSIEHYQDIMDGLLQSDIGVDRYFSYFITKQIKKTPYPVSCLFSGAK